MPDKKTAQHQPNHRLVAASSMRSYIIIPDDILPRRHLVWLVACVLGSLALLVLAVALADHRIQQVPPAPETGDMALSNAALYRACVNEARLQARTVHPYPEESRHVDYLEEGRLLWRRTEILEVDVADMSVDNGCLARRDQQLRQEMLPTPSYLDDASPMQALPIPANMANLPCTPQRDAALQSHYLLLSLCTVDALPRTQVREAARKKAALRRPNT